VYFSITAAADLTAILLRILRRPPAKTAAPARAGSACDGAEKDWALEAGAVTAGAIPARGAVDWLVTDWPGDVTKAVAPAVAAAAAATLKASTGRWREAMIFLEFLARL